MTGRSLPGDENERCEVLAIAQEVRCMGCVEEGYFISLVDLTIPGTVRFWKNHMG